MARWREPGYPGATRTTLDLLRHWGREGRDRRLFFCQLEAAETAIWLVEGPKQDRAVASAMEHQEAFEREQDRSKEAGARHWIAAVIHWGKLGHWRYAKIHSPHQLESVLAVDPTSVGAEGD